MTQRRVRPATRARIEQQVLDIVPTIAVLYEKGGSERSERLLEVAR